jgi:hypothetical protein
MQATFEKTQAAQPLGTYRPTAVDAAKTAAEVRVVSANGGSFTVRSAVALNGRGVKAYATAGVYEVTRAALASIEKRHSVACDF